MHLATCTIISCLNYDADVIDSLFELVCNISDTDFIDSGFRFNISRLGVLEFFASLIQSEYSRETLHFTAPFNVIDSLFALVCNISDTDFINSEVRFDISRVGVLEYRQSSFCGPLFIIIRL